MNGPGYRTRTVRPKIAFMHPRVFTSLLDQQKVAVEHTNNAGPVGYYQGMPIKVREDAPEDKVYIMEGRPEEHVMYEPPMVGFIDEYHHTGPLEELHLKVEAVCRLARA